MLRFRVRACRTGTPKYDPEKSVRTKGNACSERRVKEQAWESVWVLGNVALGVTER